MDWTEIVGQAIVFQWPASPTEEAGDKMRSPDPPGRTWHTYFMTSPKSKLLLHGGENGRALLVARYVATVDMGIAAAGAEMHTDAHS